MQEKNKDLAASVENPKDKNIFVADKFTEIVEVSDKSRERVEIVTDLGSQKAMGEEVRKICNSRRWINMSDKDKGDFRAGGKKLSEIARIYGIKAPNIKISYPFLELGAKIFGEEDPVLKPILQLSRFNRRMQDQLKEDRELWATEIRKLYNPEEWAEQRVEEREKIDIFGRKLNRIARIFGIEGNPVQVNSVHFALGLAIFGENEMLKSKMETAKILEKRGEKFDRRKY